MSKEIYISSTPQETRLAIVEKDELTEIYYERENEYTLAGSIYNGKVTRVLPGMQSSFVDIGLERDAFLYITDFMEEAGDSADFDGEGRAKPREPRTIEGSTENVRSEGGGDRGGRDRGRDRGRGRGRGDRDRGPREPRPEVSTDEFAPRPVAADEADEFVAAPREDAGDVGEGAPGADGGRRWRGRRGRRRGGRSGEPRVEGSAVASEPTSDVGFDEPVREAAPEREFAPRSESRGEGRGDRGGRDRDRDRGGRGGRDRDRGGRGGREDRPRGPRVDVEASASDGPQPEPFILPGESLGKYRKNEDGSPVEAPKSAAIPMITPKPSSEIVITGWDGGAVLPGETIRPRGGDRSESRDSGRDRDRGEGRGRREERDSRRGRYESQQISPAEAVLPAVTSQHEVESTHTFTDDAPAFETQEFEASLQAQAEAAHEEVYEAQTDSAPAEDVIAAPVAEAVEELHETVELQEETTEYEPGDDASASFRVDPAGTREFRQASPVSESSEPDEFTTIQASGEMISDAPVVEATHEPVAPIEHENAVQEVMLADSDDTPMTFAPGEGELEEELLDDEGDDVGALHASAYDDDMEEETLEVAADLGSMIEDMSIDSITDSEPHDDEDEYDDEEMEEDELGADEQLAGSDFSEGDEEGFAESENFDEEEFDENGEPKPKVEGAARPERSDRPRREGGRDRGRGGRDRGGRDRERSGGGDRGGRSRDSRGMAGSRSGGRSRQSAQLTDLPAISDLLKPGQEVLVQIAKEPIAKKGARITSHIALPGRFLVFMPTVSHVGVSRKIESDGERRRLKEILLSEKGEASGGFIVRTAASGASEEELRSDLRFLLNLWADIKTRSESSKSPALIYHDLNLIERILRDQVTDNFSAIWVDTEAEYERVLRFLQRFQPSLIRRVKLYSKETPLFEQFGITAEINKALAAKVWLKSGGSIVINQTEALVAIDINTGKFVGKTARLEDTILKTNLDSIPEIVRQIRLRDLGGIIIIDFIDMDERKNRNKVMAALEEELKKDRAPSKVLQFNDFGLVAITRKRVKQSLERTLSTTCAICAGTGMVKAPITVCNEIYIELRKLHKHLDKGDIMLRVNPEVVKQLKLNGGKWLQDMEEMSGKTILVKSDPSLHPEQFDLH